MVGLSLTHEIVAYLPPNMSEDLANECARVFKHHYTISERDYSTKQYNATKFK